MEQIRSLDALLATLKSEKPRHVAVAAGHDPNTLDAVLRAVAEGIARVTLVGDRARIDALCEAREMPADGVAIIDEPDVLAAGAKARDMVHGGEADVLMKGLIPTSDYMKLILDKSQGLLPAGNVLTHLTVWDMPAYRQRHDKLLFGSDVAIIPAPDLETKKKILRYCVDAAKGFGIETPKAALIAASEKVSLRMPATVEADEITRTAKTEFPDAIVHGPLALDLAISPEACEIKGVDSPLGGAADILVFPNIESGNVFYKSSTLLSGAMLAAAVVGTRAPCILTSRADSEASKFYSIALGCRLG